MAARLRCLKPTNLVFFGTDLFSLTSLRAILSLNVPVTIVTKHNCAVDDFARDVGLSVQRWPFNFAKGQFDLGVVVSFGHLIPSASIAACRFGMVNVHPSLLPRWRGAAPLVHTILANDEQTGVSLITVARDRFDTGTIIKQKLLKESPRSLEYTELERVTAAMGADMLVEFLLSDVEEELAKAFPQGEVGVTRAPKVKPSMANIDWQKSVVQIDCQRRAIAHFEPLTSWYDRRKTRLFLLPRKENLTDPDIAEVQESARKTSMVIFRNGQPCPGFAFFDRKRRLLAIRCADGWIWASHVTVIGKKKMTAQDFFNGFLNKSNCKVFMGEPSDDVDGSEEKESMNEE